MLQRLVPEHDGPGPMLPRPFHVLLRYVLEQDRLCRLPLGLRLGQAEPFKLDLKLALLVVVAGLSFRRSDLFLVPMSVRTHPVNPPDALTPEQAPIYATLSRHAASLPPDLAEPRPARIRIEELHGSTLHPAIAHIAPAGIPKLDGL